MNGEKSLSVVNVDQMIPSVEVLDAYKKQADYMVTAGMVPPGYKNGSDLLAVALRGREMGSSFWQSVQGMFPMRGRVGYMGTYLLARVKAFYPESFFTIETSTDEICILVWNRTKESEDITESFDWPTAKACHYHETWKWKDEKDHSKGGEYVEKATWKDRRNMLYWRCVSRFINRHISEVFGSPVYTADEILDMDKEQPTVPDPPYETGKPKVEPEEKEGAIETTADPKPEKTAEQKKEEDDVILKGFEEELAKLPDVAEMGKHWEAFKEKHKFNPQVLNRGFLLKREATKKIAQGGRK